MRALPLVLSAALGLSACGATPQELRRAAYLDCARAQGVPVKGGTIRARGPEDMAALDACPAVPR